MRILVVVLALVASACGSAQRDANEARLRKLEDLVLELQNDRDRCSERLDSLETRRASGETRATAESLPVIERPALKVVELVPGAEERQPGPPALGGTDTPAASSAVAPGPAVIIRGSGNRLEAVEGEGGRP